MHRLTASIGIVAVALLAFGCGSSGDDGETVEALTKSQFIKQADKACAKVVKKREAAGKAWQKDHPGELTPARLNEAFEEVMVPSVQEQVEVLRALAPPAADKAEIARMVGHLSKANMNFEEEGAEGMRRPEVSQFEAEARKYGLKTCPSRL